MGIETKPLSDQIGLEVLGLTADDLRHDDIAAELDELLAQHGVLVFREINVDDGAQVAFSRNLGEVQTMFSGEGEFPEILVVSLDPTKSASAAYLKGTFFWHIDGATDELLAEGRIGDALWARLEAELDTHQVMDLIFVVGSWTMLAMAFETWRLAPQPGMPPLPDAS